MNIQTLKKDQVVQFCYKCKRNFLVLNINKSNGNFIEIRVKRGIKNLKINYLRKIIRYKQWQLVDELSNGSYLLRQN